VQPVSSRDPNVKARVRAIFDNAAKLPEDQRLAFVRQQANGDVGLETEVIYLFASVRIPQSSSVREGTAFGPYRVIWHLGGGGMGAVYLVARSDEVFRKLAALKVIRPECMTADLLRRFQQERLILAKLEHPNIARILDGGVTGGGLPYFVMDYVKGDPIDKYCSARPLSVDQKLRLFLQVAQAVQYLHLQRIVHRDLKPSNILVAADGTVKLLDFGIAKVLSESSTGNTKTTSVMTPGYSSPEQLTGSGVTAASDVYSLAILLYELLTGSRPFQEADTPEAMLAVRLYAKPSPPSTATAGTTSRVGAESRSQLRHRLEGDLDTIILAALRKEPERRYATAGEFAADIERHLNGRPVHARNDSVSYRASKFVKRNFGRIATGVVIFVLAIWAAVASWLAFHPSDKRLGQDLREASAHQRQITQKLRGAGGSLALPRDVERDELAGLRRINDDYITSLTGSIQHRPGLTPQRSDLLAQDEQYLDLVRSAAGNDTAVLVELARGYLALGDLKGYPGQANLGDRAGALAIYEKARSVLQPLAPEGDVGRLLETVKEHAAAVRAAG
jgi:serine/threonine protein kinase